MISTTKRIPIRLFRGFSCHSHWHRHRHNHSHSPLRRIRPRGSSLLPSPSPCPSPSLLVCWSFSTSASASTHDLPAETLYIIDGTALLYKSFYGLGKQKYYANLTTTPHPIMDPATTATVPVPVSRPCGAVAAMATAFTRFCRQVRPTHVVMVFDAGRVTFRTRLYPPYKQQRAEVG